MDQFVDVNLSSFVVCSTWWLGQRIVGVREQHQEQLIHVCVSVGEGIKDGGLVGKVDRQVTGGSLEQLRRFIDA